jgi:hypothetical protein
MNGECAVEQNGARAAVPNLDSDLHAGFGRAQRDEAERMIDEMRPDIAEKDDAGGHPQVPAYQGEPIREQILAPSYDARGKLTPDVSRPETENELQPPMTKIARPTESASKK